jgi:hypothetical protein
MDQPIFFTNKIVRATPTAMPLDCMLVEETLIIREAENDDNNNNAISEKKMPKSIIWSVYKHGLRRQYPELSLYESNPETIAANKDLDNWLKDVCGKRNNRNYSKFIRKYDRALTNIFVWNAKGLPIHEFGIASFEDFLSCAAIQIEAFFKRAFVKGTKDKKAKKYAKLAEQCTWALRFLGREYATPTEVQEANYHLNKYKLWSFGLDEQDKKARKTATRHLRTAIILTEKFTHARLPNKKKRHATEEWRFMTAFSSQHSS